MAAFIARWPATPVDRAFEQADGHVYLGERGGHGDRDDGGGAEQQLAVEGVEELD